MFLFDGKVSHGVSFSLTISISFLQETAEGHRDELARHRQDIDAIFIKSSLAMYFYLPEYDVDDFKNFSGDPLCGTFRVGSWTVVLSK